MPEVMIAISSPTCADAPPDASTSNGSSEYTEPTEAPMPNATSRKRRQCGGCAAGAAVVRVDAVVLTDGAARAGSQCR